MGDRGRTCLKLEPGSTREGGQSSATWLGPVFGGVAADCKDGERRGEDLSRGEGAREYIATRAALAREGEGENSCRVREGEATPMRSRVRACKDRHADGKNAK